MSTGGLYQLLANDGAQDQLLMATELLNKRLRDIEKLRSKHPAIRDPTPTLIDIERTHILFMHAQFKPFVAVGYEYTKIGVQQGIVSLGSNITFSIPQYGDFFNDMVLHVQLTGLTTTVGNQVRYCDYIGHRLLQNVQFEVNGNFLDQYDPDMMNMHYNFLVKEDIRRAWLMNMGQEVSHPAYLTQNPGVDEYRIVHQIVDGPQTLKRSHPLVDLWIPLLFWFNRDPRLSIPSVSIPYGQRFIKMNLATADQLCAGFPAANFTAPTVSLVELYINNIFVNPEIHDIFIKRVGFSLIRVHRKEAIVVNEATGALKLDQLKYPTETLFIGLRPNVNLASMEDWHRYHSVITTGINFPVSVPNPVPPPDHALAFNDAVYKIGVPTIDNILIQTRGIELYHKTPAQFFNQYLPWNFAGGHMRAPEDIGLLMVTFNIYPGGYQPSGHLNLSRSREFFLNYESSVVGPLIPATMVVVALAINFLLVSDGSAVLRYNT